MKKIGYILLIGLAAAFLMTGCGRYDVDESTVFISKNNKITATSVESFDTSVYSEDDLKDYIRSEIDSFNEENGEKSVVLRKIRVRKNEAKLIMTYASPDIYAKFNACDFYVGTVSDAWASGYRFEGDFAQVDDDLLVQCGIDDFFGTKNCKVVITDTDARIQVKGKICYLSVSNNRFIDTKTAEALMGANLFEEIIGSGESVTESETEEIYVEDDTQISVSDGSVDDDELLLGDTSVEEEEEDLSSGDIFDFPDDAPVEEEAVYSYIIYR